MKKKFIMILNIFELMFEKNKYTFILKVTQFFTKYKINYINDLKMKIMIFNSIKCIYILSNIMIYLYKLIEI
jgi:hypothetical protein